MEEKKQRNIKTRAFLPYAGQFIHAIVVYVLTPIYLFVLMTAAVMNKPGAFLLLLLGLAVLWYFAFVVDHFKPGIRVLRDMICNSFETCEIKYENSIINRYHHFPHIKEQSEGVFLHVYCQKEHHNQRLTLYASRYHGMIQGEVYTVKYGKYSKVLISILSNTGEELWDIPFDSWRAKRNEVFSKRNRKNK